MQEAHLHKSQPLWDGSDSRAYSLDDYSLRFLRETFTGSSDDIDAIVDFLDVSTRRRYRKDQSTYCNIYAADACRALGVYLPRVWWVNPRSPPMHKPVLGRDVRELTANGISHWLTAYGAEFGWREATTLEKAQSSANGGSVAIVVATKLRGHGHISLLLAERTSGRTRQSQAGEKNIVSSEKLGAWWENGSYSRYSFWTNDRPRRTNARVKRMAAKKSALSLLARLFYPNSTRHINRVMTKDISSGHVSDNLIIALILAEDRRFRTHLGFDPIAILRAIWVMLRRRGFQGGSTIEQQLVRTLTGRRERTISRKIREICLAVYCSRSYGKDCCAVAYLHSAYFGHGLCGVSAAAARLGYDIDRLNDLQAATLIAALRYPIGSGERSSDERRKRRAEIVADNMANLGSRLDPTSNAGGVSGG
jgi:hypothetical protein